MKRNSRRAFFHEMVAFPIIKLYFEDRVRYARSGRPPRVKKSKWSYKICTLFASLQMKHLQKYAHQCFQTRSSSRILQTSCENYINSQIFSWIRRCTEFPLKSCFFAENSFGPDPTQPNACQNVPPNVHAPAEAGLPIRKNNWNTSGSAKLVK